MATVVQALTHILQKILGNIRKSTSLCAFVTKGAGGFHEWMDTVRLARQEASAAMDTKLRIWCKKNNWSVRYARGYISKTREFRYHVDEHFCPMDDQSKHHRPFFPQTSKTSGGLTRTLKPGWILADVTWGISAPTTSKGYKNLMKSRNHWYEKHYQYS
ncbi:uncharacterized protein EI90DRAFT_3013037 [Cantharellus anzutake]|uniref:uncharacterized protein n=1 Tax=Cantharellus anzutake TaxID=1750568 RepID=UPI001908F6CA|nr:uncharacterized protein EI90DRAFT_3013037 [Cantharellus anzutake]KAF8338921.1 hypothetical protein EI90DRAFT_3013037 [Cantharellus anzutake]